MDTSEDLSGDVLQLFSPEVATELAVPLILQEVDNGGVFEILRHLPLAPHRLEVRCELVHKLGSAMLVDLSRVASDPGAFPLESCCTPPNGFLERGQEINVGVYFHFRQSVV
ncbi:unnamed protein product [Schistocephalus solidus]|uniref:Uncharacterized protein n=1 Tax=Schistocephalus solidus TaxID=70667 RepID=A0A183T5Z7_SCHSO|nr:unnamed protein product [Schistocephalus solidus]